GRGGLRQPQAPPLSARGGVDRACRCQRPALAAVQFGLRPDRRVVVEVQRGTSSGRGAGARGPVQCCWRDPGPCNAPGYPRLVQPQWTVRNSCVNRARIKNSGVKKLIDVRLNNVSQLAGFTKKNDLKYFVNEICNIEYIHLFVLAPTQEILTAYKTDKGDWGLYER